MPKPNYLQLKLAARAFSALHDQIHRDWMALPEAERTTDDPMWDALCTSEQMAIDAFEALAEREESWR